jgi:hypothetical protein
MKLVQNIVESLENFLGRIVSTVSPQPMAQMGFGPNRVVVEVRRALRDDSGIVLRDVDGNVLYSDEVEIYENHNVTCNAGLDAAKDRLFNPATSETVAKYIALSESNDAPSAAHTVMADEITQSGLERAAATYSTSGCSTGECILSNDFTATGSFSSVQLMALFDASSAGDMYFEATITSVALESGDQLTAKWDKITLS